MGDTPRKEDGSDSSENQSVVPGRSGGESRDQVNDLVTLGPVPGAAPGKNDTVFMLSAEATTEMKSTAVEGGIANEVKEMNFGAIRIPYRDRAVLKKLRKAGISTDKLSIAQAREIYEQRKVTTASGKAGRSTPAGKRFWSGSDRTPAPTGGHCEDVKKRKVEGSSCRAAFNSAAIKVAIIPVDYPATEIDQKMADRMRGFVIEEIDKLEEEAPQFEGCRFMEGYLGFICKDLKAKEFLQKLFGEKSKMLKVVDVRDLPHKIKVLCYLPEKAESSLILSRIQKQNSSLRCDKWHEVTARTDEKGFYQVVYAIDAESKAQLEKLEYRVYYLVCKVSFRLLGIRGKQEEQPEAAQSNGGEGSSGAGQPATD